MQTSSGSGPFKIAGSSIHQLGVEFRKKHGEGSCTISEESDDVILRIKHFAKNIAKLELGKIQYKNSLSYFYYEPTQQNRIQVLSFSKIDNSQMKIQELDAKLKQTAKVSTIQANKVLLGHIESAYPKWEERQVQNSGSKISKELGGFIGSISGLMTQPMESVGKTVGNKTDKIYETQIKDDTKSKWQTLKEKASALNLSISTKIKPISDGAKNATNSMGQSFDKSDNAVIKAIRNFGLSTKKALNEGYNEGMGKKKQNKKPQYAVQSEYKMNQEDSAQ